MSAAIIITICTLLLVAYLFDISSKYTRIPSVLLLLLLGWLVRQGTVAFDIPMADISVLLPAFGTIGLILIVLEGSLELELNQTKTSLIKKSFMAALFPILALTFLAAFAFSEFGHYGFRDSLANAIPLAVISSSIAIPSARNLSLVEKEFVTYESSFSDIIGVLFFNFVVLNETIGMESFGTFSLQFLVMVVLSFIATILLSLLLNRINHHIKFAPIILLVILFYEISKVFHLPGLIFILVFGLFLGNVEKLSRFKWIQKFNPEKLDMEVHKFKEIVTEAAFLVRAMFFILFGFLIETEEIINTGTLGWSIAISVAIFILRAIFLYLLKLPLRPLLFIAPRGLITILLFLAIPVSQKIPLVNNSLVLQVVLLTALFMMMGLLFTKTEPRNGQSSPADAGEDAAV